VAGRNQFQGLPLAQKLAMMPLNLLRIAVKTGFTDNY
jgi:hypothetical protein